MRPLTIALALFVVVGCVQYPDGRFACTADSDCPGALRCASVDHRCHVNPANVDASLDATASLDTGTSVDTAVDAGPATIDLPTLVDPMALHHPANGTAVQVTGTLVALSGRLTVPAGAGHCNYVVWVGDARGGPHSGIRVYEGYIPPAGVDGSRPDAGPLNCSTVEGMIPASIAIGDTVTALAGRYDLFCPGGATCPSGVGQEINVTLFGTFTVGAHGPAPASMIVPLVDIAGDATASVTDYQYQGALVQLSNVFMQQPPTAGNSWTMTVGTSPTGGSTMPVVVDHFATSACVAAALAGMSAGTNIGNVTGILTYSTFGSGRWTIQVRQATDISGVTGC